MANFTSFNESEKKNPISQNELLNLAITISMESGKLLGSVKYMDMASVNKIASSLKSKLESILDEVRTSIINPPEKILSTSSGYLSTRGNYSSLDSNKNNSDNPNHAKASAYPNRALDNGGMAPPKEWKSITEINLKNSEKYDLVEEMRKLKEQGTTIRKSNFHHKIPISIEEFTEPFKYMENMHDYNGSFLITLLKSEIEISNQSSILQTDLVDEKIKCMNGENIILSVFDISGSSSNGEEKKFLIVLFFDKLNGMLKYSHVIFADNSSTPHSKKLSPRQLAELERFCRTKKINY